MHSAESEVSDNSQERGIFEEFDNSERLTPTRRRAMIMIALGEFLDGYDLIAIAGALLQLTSQFDLTPNEVGLLGASAFFGAGVGLLGAGYIADRIGRKKIFVYNFWLFAVLAVVSAMVQNFEQLFVSRFLIGVAIGADIAISIPFLGEIAPRKMRGRWAGAIPQMAWTSGAIASLAMALFLIEAIGPDAWRWLFGLGAIPALIILAGRHGLPESPHWLLSQGRVAEAEAAMRAFGVTGASSIAAPSETDVQASAPKPAANFGSYLDIFRAPNTYRAWFVVIVLGIGPFVGSAASVVAPYVMHFVGFMGPKASLQGSILIWCGGLLGSFLAFLTVDKIGRLRSSATAFWGNAACLLLLVTFLDNAAIFVTVYVIYGVFVWFGASSNWLLPTEFLPANLRARAQGLCSGMSRVSTGLATWFIPTSVARFGFGTTFSFLACIGIVLGFFILAHQRFERKGESLQV